MKMRSARRRLRNYFLATHPHLSGMKLYLTSRVTRCRRHSEDANQEDFSGLGQYAACSKTVLGGPFEGMTYDVKAVCSEALPKLFGTYESELHSLVREIPQKGYARLINVGSAEGYYAVGLALKLGDIDVIAVDPSWESKRQLRKLAASNNVNSIRFFSWLSPAGINRLIVPNTFLLMDCEGAEVGLLNPSRVKALIQCDVLVEVHDFVVPDLTRILVERFRDTHRVNVIEQERRKKKGDFPALASLRCEMARRIMDERRPKNLRWLYIERKARA